MGQESDDDYDFTGVWYMMILLLKYMILFLKIENGLSLLPHQLYYKNGGSIWAITKSYRYNTWLFTIY